MTNPCPTWCELDGGHPFDEEISGNVQVVTQLSRIHARVLDTAWSQVQSRDLLTIATDVVITQEEIASLSGECVSMPAQVMMREARDYSIDAILSGEQRRPLGVSSMTPDQTEALADLLAIGARACRAIAAGEAPHLP